MMMISRAKASTSIASAKTKTVASVTALLLSCPARVGQLRAGHQQADASTEAAARGRLI
jgi:hypothetical protein